jgi:hypothetical protein
MEHAGAFACDLLASQGFAALGAELQAGGEMMTRQGQGLPVSPRRLTPVPVPPGTCPKCLDPLATCDGCLRDTCHDPHAPDCWRNVVPPTG